MNLNFLIPKAIEWAEEQVSYSHLIGTVLDERELLIARRADVANPEKIRLSLVPRIPLPTDKLLREVAVFTGLLGSSAVGLTLGYIIYIRNGFYTSELLSHECRHVHQYEQAGSIAAFLCEYLEQILQFGYEDAPYEVDARRYEFPERQNEALRRSH